MTNRTGIFSRPLSSLAISLLFFFSLVFNTNSFSAEKIEITDSHGKWVFDQPPKRIAIINWTLAEQVIELGIIPVAIADIPGFQKTAPQTLVPAKTVNLGSRFTPNLSILKELAPELIIIGYSQRDLLRPLSNIAPVMYFNNFSRRYNNAKKADERFLVLAKLFGKTKVANETLENRDHEMTLIASKISQHFSKDLPTITIASIKDTSTWLFLNNSIPFSVANHLGFKSSPIEKKPSKFGVHKITLDDLATLDGCLFLLNSQKLAAGSIEVKNPQCLKTLTTSNAYGGSLSQLYLARAIAEAFAIDIEH